MRSFLVLGILSRIQSFPNDQAQIGNCGRRCSNHATRTIEHGAENDRGQDQECGKQDIVVCDIKVIHNLPLFYANKYTYKILTKIVILYAIKKAGLARLDISFNKKLPEYFIVKIRSELLEITLNQDNRNHNRNHPLDIEADNLVRRELEAFASVDFGIKLFFAPAALVATEYNENERTYR